MMITNHRSLRFACAALVLLADIALSTSVRAEPYIALREGHACADCHVNRTGGGMRTLLVEFHAAQIFNLPNDGKGLFPAGSERISPTINEFFSIGADFRAVNRLSFRDDPDRNGEVDNNTAFREPTNNEIVVDEASVYAEFRPIPGYLSLYIDERFAPDGADNREAFALVQQVLPAGAYLKAGRFFPAWGLKIRDDAAFVNSLSGFSFTRSVTGVEVGRGGDGLSWFASVTDGAEGEVEPLLTGSAYYNWTDVGGLKSLMAGASAAYEAPGDDRFAAYTGFAGLSVGPLVLLGQGVFRDTEIASVSKQSWAAYGEADYLLGGWANAKLAFDYLDPDTEQSDDATNRVSIGLEPFLDQFLQVSLFYRVFNGPKNQPSTNRDELTLELHLFF